MVPPQHGPPLVAPPMAPGPPPGPTPPFTLWAVLGIVQTVLSCGVNLLFGVLGATFAFIGRSEWARGEYDAAMGRLRVSKILNVIGFVVFAILVVVVMLVRLASGSSFGAFPMP